MDITREITGSHGRYAMTREGEAAELTYTVSSPTHIVADHTYVPDRFRGTGAGKALFARLVADARAEGVTITPACSFVAAQAREHPELADLFRA